MDSIPFVIDNQSCKLGDIINATLKERKEQSLDIASASFHVGGWLVLAEELCALGSVRLLLGDEPVIGEDIGLYEVSGKLVEGLTEDLCDESFYGKTLRAVDDLTAFLRQENVEVRLYTKGVLHAKCYLFYSTRARFQPLMAIVGSSNFTRAGLHSDKELNLVYRTSLRPEETSLGHLRGLLEVRERQRLGQLDPADRLVAASISGVLAVNELAEWYDRQWEDARDFKRDLLDLLDASQFGRLLMLPGESE